MPSVQVTLAFASSAGFGWSETYHYNGTVSGLPLPVSIIALMTARMNLCTTEIACTHIRVQSSVKRNPFIFLPNNGNGFLGIWNGPTQQSDVALLVRGNAGVTGFNRIFLRGLPEAMFASQTYTPTPAFNTDMTAFSNVWVGSGLWNAVGTLGSSPARFPTSPPQGLTPRGYTFTAPTATLAVGDKVRMHAASIPGYNGLKQVVAISPLVPPVYTVGGAGPPVQEPSLATYITKITPFDAVLTSFLVEGVTRRAAGRPFGQSRGRQATTYSLRR